VEEALRKSEEYWRSVVSTMAEGDRPGLARQLKAKRPDLKVLFVSGYSETFISGAGEQGSSLELLKKPFTADDL
jgi:hypothetical protein